MIIRLSIYLLILPLAIIQNSKIKNVTINILNIFNKYSISVELNLINTKNQLI